MANDREASASLRDVRRALVDAFPTFTIGMPRLILSVFFVGPVLSAPALVEWALIWAHCRGRYVSMPFSLLSRFPFV